MTEQHKIGEQEQRNKELFRRAAEELFGRKDFAAVDRYFSPSFIQHNPNAPPGPEGVKKFFGEMVFTALPDIEIKIDHLYAEGDKVFAFVRWIGTHKAPFFGIPPSGKQVILKTSEIMRIENGRLAEHWDVVDLSDLIEKSAVVHGGAKPER